MFPEDARAGMNRRDFLRIGGFGLAGAVLLGSGGRAVLAQSDPSLDAIFRAAAKEYGVPRELLKAMGYVNTGWEMPPPSTTPFEPDSPHGRGDYGIMQLTQTPSEDTLGEATDLTGLSEREIKAERQANVRGAAAVLAEMSGPDRPSDLNGWYGVVSEYGGGPLYANEVYDVLNDGAIATTTKGERLELTSRPGVDARALPASKARADYGRATWYGAHSRNHTNASRRAAQIDKIVIHVAEGSYSGTLNWFNNPSSRSSAHYTISRYGAVGQSVREEDIAWHAGWWDTNKQSIGIEHAGYVRNPDYWFTKKMYEASARLSAVLCKKYKIPVSRQYIIGHNQVPGCDGRGGGVSCHTDPGGGWNWTKYIRKVKKHRRQI